MTNPSTGRDDEGMYDLAPDVPVAAAPVKGSRRSAAAGPVVLGYRGAPAAAGFDERRLKDFQLPLVLLCGGIVIEVVAAALRTRAFEPAMREVGVGVIIGTVLMLAGIIPAARWRGIELGAFWTVVLKLAVITVTPAAVVHLAGPVLNFVPFGGIVGWIAEFVLYFALLGVLFDLDESDTWYCVCVIFLVRLGVYFLLLAVVWKWM